MVAQLREMNLKETSKILFLGNGNLVFKRDADGHTTGYTYNTLDTVTHHFQRVLKANGLLCIRFHDLRHSVVYTLR